VISGGKEIYETWEKGSLLDDRCRGGGGRLLCPDEEIEFVKSSLNDGYSSAVNYGKGNRKPT
jgi:hypothetical protein